MRSLSSCLPLRYADLCSLLRTSWLYRQQGRVQGHPQVQLRHRGNTGLVSHLLQPTIATSSSEAELYAQFEAAHCVQHFRRAAQFLKFELHGPTVLYTDSQ